MDFYCETCHRLCTSEKENCCYDPKIREVTAQDYCFLLVADDLHSEMLYDCFVNEGIECALKPAGKGYRSAFGFSLGNYIIYVLYSQYEQAKKIAEIFYPDPTNDLREDLIKHRDLWHINKRAYKRLRKKLKLESPGEIIDKLVDFVNTSDSILDKGVISSGPEGAHYVFVNNGELSFWFNSATYEIFT